tara:strand:- start:159 stop:854 length:696 start_codon:yes stop_codon:yes gene_type:complete
MATITITPGNSFTATEAVTSTKLNDLGLPTAALTAASIGTADIADDAITTALIADDAITTALIVDDAITTALIADDAITTPAILDANVTFAKLTDVIDSDTMTGATSTNLATSESIKAYVDANSGLQGSTATGTITGTSSFQELDLSSVVGSNKAMVIMEVFGGNLTRDISFRTKGSPITGLGGSSSVNAGNNGVGGTVVVTTDSSGKLEYRGGGPSIGITYVVQAFQVIS